MSRSAAERAYAAVARERSQPKTATQPSAPKSAVGQCANTRAPGGSKRLDVSAYQALDAQGEGRRKPPPRSAKPIVYLDSGGKSYAG